MKFLTLAAGGGHHGALALLGYMHSLGLGGLARDLRVAEDYFKKSVSSGGGDALGYNGLGYLEFKNGNLQQAFQHFNESAVRDSADGMFNLASLYLTGAGTGQNFHKAFFWYSQVK